ncbi:MAG: pilus (MSHA type) biogenesis protein MshL [Parashewanella sp.]
MKLNQYVVFFLSISLVGCQVNTELRKHKQPSIAQEQLQQAIATHAPQASSKLPPALPADVQQEIHSDLLQTAQLPVAQERRFDVNANDVDAKIFFASLIRGTPLSVVVHPNVTGQISLSLKAVTLNEVLQVVQDIYGYEINREGRILRIYPAGLRTETFPINYLFMQRQGTSLTSINSGRISDNQNGGGGGGNRNSSSRSERTGSPLSENSERNSQSNSQSNSGNGTFIRSSNENDFWKDLKETLTALIGEEGDGRQVVVTPQAGLATIRAYPDELRQVKTFLSKAENHLQRQVILETKIIEVTLSDGYQQGIRWENIVDKNGTNGRSTSRFSTGLGQPLTDAISKTLGGTGAFGFTFADRKNNNFSAMINLLKTQGDVDVLSSPRVTASNNQKAVIKVGNDEYFVTNVSSTVVNNGGSNSAVTQPNVELTPFFSGIALDVMPQIDDNGGVLLHVHPSVISINEEIKSINTGAEQPLQLPLAQSEIRESDTVIKANSGQIVVIGGLMKSEKSEQVSKVPLLGDIPFLGEAFTNRRKMNKKTELIILLKPTVVGEGTWKSELERSQQLLNKWYQ